ncbi:MAG: DUF2807 domain-containing protein [Vicingaceae bacterium]|nr:DUF2807 domain-containing protein [Vicingaceae bacterium]
MKKIIVSIISLLIVGQIFAQSINREIEDFNFLQVKNALEVELVHGDKNTVVISGVSTEDAEKIKTEIKDGELLIASEGKLKSKDAIVVQLTYKNLRGIRQSGSSEITMTNAYKSDKFSVQGSGAIEADFKLEVIDLSVDFSGASDIKLSGSATNFDLVLSGASDLKAQEFIAQNIKVNVSGASDLKVYAAKSITGKASGASNINVKGSPEVRAINSSTATSTSYYSENVSINMGKNNIDIRDENVNANLGNKGVDVNSDTAVVKWGVTRVVMIGDSVSITRTPKPRKNHWAGVDLGINGFMTSGGSLDLSNPAHFEQTNPEKVTQFMELDLNKSWTVSINFLELYIPIKNHHFGLVTGLGTEWNNYELKNNVRLTPQGGEYVFDEVNEYNQDYTWGVVDTNFNLTKNRFKTWFVNAPLLLEINPGKTRKKTFHLSTGAIFGLNLQTKMKYKFNDKGEDKKVKDKDSFNTNPFRVSLTARAGIGWFNVFATYSLTPLFESGSGPELYPFSVGVTLVGF